MKQGIPTVRWVADGSNGSLDGLATRDSLLFGKMQWQLEWVETFERALYRSFSVRGLYVGDSESGRIVHWRDTLEGQRATLESYLGGGAAFKTLTFIPTLPGEQESPFICRRAGGVDVLDQIAITPRLDDIEAAISSSLSPRPRSSDFGSLLGLCADASPEAHFQVLVDSRAGEMLVWWYADGVAAPSLEDSWLETNPSWIWTVEVEEIP